MSDVTRITTRTTNSALFNSNTSKLLETTRTAGTKLATGKNFSTRLEADKSGLTGALDKARGELLIIDKYELTSVLAKANLAEQEVALDDFASIITEFDAGANATSLAQLNLTPQEFADSLLDKLKNVLNRQGTDGYIFGGQDSSVMPIQGDLSGAANSNLLNANVPVSNFTNAVADDSKVEVSQNVSVPNHVMTANDDFIVKFVGALHRYRNEGQAIPSAGVIGLIGEVDKGSQTAFFDITSGLQDITDAEDKNINHKTRVLEKLELDDVDVLQQQGLFTAATMALTLALSVQQGLNRLTDRISNTLTG